MQFIVYRNSNQLHSELTDVQTILNGQYLGDTVTVSHILKTFEWLSWIVRAIYQVSHTGCLSARNPRSDDTCDVYFHELEAHAKEFVIVRANVL